MSVPASVAAIDRPVRRWGDPRAAARQPEIAEWLKALRAGAVTRERDRVLLHGELRGFAFFGLGAVRVPVADGGQGWTVPQLLEFVRLIAAADSNAAHALRNHFLFAEIVLALAPGEKRIRWLSRLVQGDLLGDANSEREGAISKGGSTRLTRVDDGYRLSGEKFYSTGCLYADWMFVTAYDAHDVLHWVMVPAQSPGVDLIDDWDGFGQRLTGSGTTRFADVFVPDADVLVPNLVENGAPVRQGAFAQLYLTTVIAGILDNILADAVDLLQHRPRNFPHGSAAVARDDPLLLEPVGYLSAAAFAARAAIAAAGEAIEELGHARRAGQDADAAYAQAALAAAQAKLTVDDLAARAGWLLFDTGGGSATSAALALDRHWRNARTVASHNPRSFKARAIGDFLVNGAPLPRSFF